MSTKRMKKLPRGWVGTADMAKALDIPTRSLLRGARAGRIPADAFKKVNSRYTFKKKAVEDTWYLNMDPKHVKRPQGGKTKLEISIIQDGAESNHTTVDRSQLDMTGASDEILDDLREKLNKMNGTEINNAVAAIKVIQGEIAIAQLRNDLIRREDVYGELFNYGQRVRHRLEAVPVRIVDEVMSCDDRVEAMGVIQDAIDNALTELTQIPKSLKPG